MPEQPNTIVLDKEALEKLFAEGSKQGEVLLAIFAMLYPNGLWDQIERLTGFPVCSKDTSKWIFDKFIRFDQQHHPGVMAGGAWMNHGFSVNGGDDLPLFHVIPATYELKAVDPAMDRELAPAHA